MRPMSDLLRGSHPQNSLQMAFYALTPVYLLAIGLFFALARVLKAEGARG